MQKLLLKIKKVCIPALLLFSIFCLIFNLFSCSQGRLDPFDPVAGMRRSEIKDTLIKNNKAEKFKLFKSKDDDDIPNVSKLISVPLPPNAKTGIDVVPKGIVSNQIVGGERIVSFSVTDQVPLKDVLIELGRIAKIDVDMDSGIHGSIIITAQNRPLKEVIDRIADLGSLRYSYKNGVLHFERDLPYMKNYFVDYLVGGSLWGDVESNIQKILDAAEDSPAAEADAQAAIAKTTIAKASYSSNKSAGIISIFSTNKQHQAVSKYLDDVARHASAQVLIEAKIIEVTLKDTFKTGIDWSWDLKFGNGKSGSVALAGTNIADGVLKLPVGPGIKKIFGGNMSGTINALEEFGTTRTISSPRIHAINNQKATISFTDKLVYFTVINTQSLAGAQTGVAGGNVVASASTSTKQEENIGTQLSITPSINLETNEITMNIKPKLSVKSDTVADPVNPSNLIPVIQTREIETTAKIKSGNVVVIGGLMKQDTNSNDKGVPLLNRIPVIGWFFKTAVRTNNITETVIFIKATIISSSTSVGQVDRDLQEKFDSGRRQYFED